MNQYITAILALGWSALASAGTIHVGTFGYSGPHKIAAPLMIDSVDVNSRKFEIARLLDSHLSLDNVRNGSTFTGAVAPGADDSHALHLLGFTAENRQYVTGQLNVKGLKNYAVYVDGTKLNGSSLALEPATHSIVIKYLSQPDSTDSLAVEIETEHPDRLVIGNDPRHIMTLDDVLHATRINGASLSPDGKMLITGYSTTRRGGKTEYTSRITSVADGRLLAERRDGIAWMPVSNRYYFTRNGLDGRELVTVDPLTAVEQVIARNLPDGRFTIAPTEDYLIFTLQQEGPKESDVYQVLEPEDRQPGWRNRSYLAKYDLATGLMQPLTHGYHNVWLADISDDGRKLLIGTSRSRLTQRPTTLTTFAVLTPDDMKLQPVVEDDGFVSGARFSPDGKSVLVSGSPEALGGIGKNVPEGRTPSMTDNQLFLVDVASRKATPLTAGFDPSVNSYKWSAADGMIYLTAEDCDRYSLFRIDPTSGKITKIPVPEDMVNNFTTPRQGNTLVWYGQGASNSDHLYTLNTRTLKSTLIGDPSGKRLKDVKLGTCSEWSFLNSNGDSIHGRFYLPNDFDPSRKYPMIVNYYGGCSPTSRNFESRYPHHAYAAQGYVVYVIVPSGATGQGQEFSSRHVNTAGEGVARDIIEGTQQFCKEHPYVDASKIGCIGASYGGFMTQYLQTQTDLFAAAISHAGISDHTSYWGEGYWGYSYSEVSMANSYPWSHPDLYVKQSPLFNADKINTPLLFLHGDKDNNVPVGESIQMFTALKLLGKETAFVAVTGEDHHILDYDKRKKWQNTIFAWFAKWLKDDPSWWDAIYTPKSL